MSRVTQLAAAHMARHATRWEADMSLPSWRRYRSTISIQADRQHAAEREPGAWHKLIVALIGAVLNYAVLILLFGFNDMPLLWLLNVLITLWALQAAEGVMAEYEGRADE